MSTPNFPTTTKESIESHLSQLKDMTAHYPEGESCFKILINHLKGLLNTPKRIIPADCLNKEPLNARS